MLEIVLPPGWPRPSGYANAVAARGTLIFIAGQIGWTPERQFAGDDFVTQTRQALLNIRQLLETAGSNPAHLTRLTWYVTDKQEYLAHLDEVGGVYREVIGRYFPAMTLIQVAALVEDRARVEIEAMAVIPDPAPLPVGGDR